MKCPVCPAPSIPDDATECPICKTDLTTILKVRELAKVHYNAALNLAEAGAADSALSRLEAALALDGQFIPARIVLGKLLWKSERQREAVQCWKKVLTIEPGQAEAQSLLTAAQKQMRRQFLGRHRTIIGALLTVILALFLIVHLPLRGTHIRLDQIAATLNDMKIDPESHIPPDSLARRWQFDLNQSLSSSFPYPAASDSIVPRAYNSVVSSLGQVPALPLRLTQADDITPILMSAVLSDTDSLGKFLARQIQGLGQRQSDILISLNRLESLRRADATASRTALDNQSRLFQESLLTLFRLLSIQGLVDISDEIVVVRQQIDSLESLSKKYQTRNFPIIDHFKYLSVQKKLQQINNRREKLQSRYQARLLPWEEAVKNLKLGELLMQDNSSTTDSLTGRP
ncbi:MAG: tetratricopeptide repeat protein [Calditrichota bacterium]